MDFEEEQGRLAAIFSTADRYGGYLYLLSIIKASSIDFLLSIIDCQTNFIDYICYMLSMVRHIFSAIPLWLSVLIKMHFVHLVPTAQELGTAQFLLKTVCY